MAAHILIVDDEPHLEIVIQQLFRKRIKSGELVFYFAANGQEALSLLENHGNIEMVFSDINMPKMSGLTLLKNLNERYPLLRTVVITAYGDMKNIRAAMNHGAFDFLNKPLNFNDLKITMEKTLNHVRQLRELHRERQQRYLAEKLRALTESLTSTLDMTEVLDRFLKNLDQLVCFDQALICMKEKSGLKIVTYFGQQEIEETHELTFFLKGLYGEVSLSQKPLVVKGGDHPSFFEKLDDDEAKPEILCLPLFSKRGIPGMVILRRGAFGAFQDHEKDMAFSICSQAAFAIENARLFEKVRCLAITDSLTGLFNRRHFLEQAEKEVVRSLRYGNPLSAIMIDIDKFKNVNDSHGHPAGDKVLKSVAKVLSEGCRQTDFIGRYGGDEIVILLIETGFELAREIAERFRQQVSETCVGLPSGKSASVTISLGVSVLGKSDDSVEKLIHRADKMLFLAKESGRNCIQVPAEGSPV